MRLFFVVILVTLSGYVWAQDVNYCAGTTKAGKPCGNRVKSGEMFCRVHRFGEISGAPKNSGGQAVQCHGTTKAGKRCKNVVSFGLYCRYHKN